MTSEEPHISRGALYQMGAAARLLGIGTTTLQRYTQQGYIRARVRKANGRRVWRGEDLVMRWRQIY